MRRRTRPFLLRRHLLAALLPAACAIPPLPRPPANLRENWPKIAVTPPARDVPPAQARFGGLWATDRVRGFAETPNTRTVLGVTEIMPNGNAWLVIAETVPGGILDPGAWHWVKTEFRGYIDGDVLTVGSRMLPRFWLVWQGGDPPTLIARASEKYRPLAGLEDSRPWAAFRPLTVSTPLNS